MNAEILWSDKRHFNSTLTGDEKTRTCTHIYHRYILKCLEGELCNKVVIILLRYVSGGYEVSEGSRVSSQLELSKI